MSEKSMYAAGTPVTLEALNPGDKVVVTGMTCMENDSVHEVKESESGGLYVDCADGSHFLDGQSDGADKPLVGVRRAPALT